MILCWALKWVLMIIFQAFVTEELVARVKAHLRRERRSLQIKPCPFYRDIQIFPESYEVKVNNKPVELTTREFQLYIIFFKMPEK